MNHSDAGRQQPPQDSTFVIAWRRVIHAGQADKTQTVTSENMTSRTIGSRFSGCACGRIRQYELNSVATLTDEIRRPRWWAGRIPIIAAIITAAGAVIAAVITGA